MKKLTLFIIMLISFSASKAQVVISLDREKNIYMGVANPIAVIAQNYRYQSLKLTTDNGKVSGSDGHYFLHPERVGETNIKVFTKTKKGLKKIGTGYFIAKHCPAPSAFLLKKTDGYIAASEIHVAIAPYLVNTYACIKNDLDSCTIIVIRHDSVIFCKTIHNDQGVRFSDDKVVDSMIRALQPMDKLKIMDITYQPKYTGEERYVKPLEFTITE